MRRAAGRPSSSVLLVVAATALTGAAMTAWLGSREFVGTFGAAGQPLTCGSVWGLLAATDLNAASCRTDLLNRLTLVSTLVGTTGVLMAAAVIIRRRQSHPSSAGNRAVVLAAFLIPLILSVTVWAVGRHLAWSVSGA